MKRWLGRNDDWREAEAFNRWLGELEFPPAKLLEGESVKDDPARFEAIRSTQSLPDVKGVGFAKRARVRSMNELVVQRVARVDVGDGETVIERCSSTDDLLKELEVILALILIEGSRTSVEIDGYAQEDKSPHTEDDFVIRRAVAQVVGDGGSRRKVHVATTLMHRRLKAV